MGTSQPAPQPARTKGQARLEEVLDAAEEVLKRHGVEGLSVRAVAQQVGISVGNLQYYLPTRAALLDAVARLQDGVLGDAQSHQQDSFSDGLLDCPHYTRPEEYEGVRVPDVLLGGHHAEIEKWRRQQALLNTMHKRPDLIEAARKQGLLSRSDEAFLAAAATTAKGSEASTPGASTK